MVYYMDKINVEIKAVSSELDRIRKILYELNAQFRGTDHQKDTYFNVQSGRLKLREGTIEHGLIYYQRPDDPAPKRSDVIIYRTESYTDLKQILSTTLGIKIVVEKSGRSIILII